MNTPTTCAAVPRSGDSAHARPIHSLTIAEAQRIMQQHKACRAVGCPRKATALRCLVREGKLVPATVSPRERAATRGLRFPVAEQHLPVRVGPELQTLLDVMDGLTNLTVDYHARTARLFPGSHESSPRR
ncbi:hypothetical protein [Nocardia anaemiae]|uniref:hypothetical protein n=1 Tax=Nocardia anaemiae TaxID=263910 RepID=UPI0007A4191E|nr:hypothetical protein [Nocardia anaemiae]